MRQRFTVKSKALAQKALMAKGLFYPRNVYQLGKLKRTLSSVSRQ